MDQLPTFKFATNFLSTQIKKPAKEKRHGSTGLDAIPTVLILLRHPVQSCHVFKKNKNGCFVFDFFGLDLSKMDQTWSKWISHQSKNVTIKSCHIYR